MKRRTRLGRYFWLPALAQFALLFAAVALFVRIAGRDNGVRELMPALDAGGELTNPNAARLAYLLASCVAAIALAFGARAMGKRSGARAEAAAFWLADLAGLLLWQGLGECAWHFGLPLAVGPAGQPSQAWRYVLFMRLESAAAWPTFGLAVALLAYCRRKGAFSPAAWVFALSFMGNWFGHIVLIGTYPLASAAMGEAEWFRLCGVSLGIAVTAWGLYRAIKKDAGAWETRVSSLVFYTGLGIIAMGVRGG